MTRPSGRGSFERPLTGEEVESLCVEALGGLALAGRSVLVLIPDDTRHACTELFFRSVCRALAGRVRVLDFLIATGTHAPMEKERIYRHVGITAAEHAGAFRGVRFFNHDHRDASSLRPIGTIPGEEVRVLTEGALADPVNITINRMALEYDHLVLVTPVVPHEAMGFAGGNKYFFPGIAGLELVETFHWLAALLTNPRINGIKHTPTRRLIDRAARFLPTPRTCLAYAVNERDEPMCLFAGDPETAWSAAADYSARLHIRYLPKPHRRVLALTPHLYEDLWVGGKAVYKLEPVVADGGEVIVYGPQIRVLSFVHEEAIRRIGYHVIGFFTGQRERFRRESRLIMAHSSNVRGIGAYEEGRERPRIRVTLATSIPEEVCRSVNLGYLDPRSAEIAVLRAGGEEGVLVVENAGQNLYRLEGERDPAGTGATDTDRS
ncbi:MAG: lactate racemase domain-containing protein [Bacteroidota bacterium]